LKSTAAVSRLPLHFSPPLKFLVNCYVAENYRWVGIGFSLEGLMIGSQAIIGISAQGTVLKFK
jgi:hypothetical protein